MSNRSRATALWQSVASRHGLKRFGRILPNQVVAIDDPVNLVQRADETVCWVPSKRRELPVLAFSLSHDANKAKSKKDLPSRDPITIEPKHAGEFLSIPSIGLVLGRLFGVNQNDLSALPFSQLFDQPIVEATHLEDRHELGVPSDQLFKERFNLLGPGAHLSTQHGSPFFIADTNRGSRWQADQWRGTTSSGSPGFWRAKGYAEL